MSAHSQKSKTIAGALLVFLVALLLRLPYISYPPEIVFDEGAHTSFISYYFHKKAFFDNQPPLTPMVFSAALWGKNVPLVSVRDVASPHSNFPYTRLRTLNAIAGSLLAGVIFLIAARLYRNLWFAVLPASFVVFDNALIAHSRAILPETLLLLFGFSGILCWMLSDGIANNEAKQKTFWKSGWGRGQSRLRDWGVRISKMSFVERYSQNPTANILVHWGPFLIAALLWALAASVKLTGLGFLLTAFLFLFYRKQYAKIAAALVVFALVYTAVFFIFFSTIRDSAPPYTHFRNQEIQKIDFSTSKTITNFIPFFIQHHRATLLAHREVPVDPAIHPMQWPFYHRSIGFWGKSNSERINVSGNMVIWVSTTLAVLVALVAVVLSLMRNKATQEVFCKSRAGARPNHSYDLGGKDLQKTSCRAFFANDIPALPLVGYLANYVPFLVVPRALYLYHYFAALIFGFLLLPALVGFFAELVLDETSKNKIALALILLAILWYIVLVPRTYGIPFYSLA